MLYAKYEQSVAKIRSDFTFSYKRIDPFANTTPLAMLQPNNQTFEFDSKHRISSNLNMGLIYKYQSTLRQMAGNNSITIQMAGGDIGGSVKDYLSYSLFLNHINYTMKSSSFVPQRGVNYLFGATVSANYHSREHKLSSTLSTNDYLISDSSSISKFTQFGYAQSIGGKHFKFTLSYDYFYNNSIGISTGTNLFSLNGEYKVKKIELGMGLKLASIQKGKNSLGGYFEVNWEVSKFLNLGIRAERFVQGNYYRSYYATAYKQFPYLITIHTQFKLK